MVELAKKKILMPFEVYCTTTVKSVTMVHLKYQILSLNRFFWQFKQTLEKN